MQVDKKALMIVAHERFRDEEYVGTRRVLERNGVQVTVASSYLSEAHGRFGTLVQPDTLVSRARAEDYDAIVFVGGVGSAEYFHNPSAHHLAQSAARQQKVVAAICSATCILAYAGVLRGKRATVFPSDGEIIRGEGAIYTSSDVERDERFVTANGPQSAEKFGQTISDVLAGKL